MKNRNSWSLVVLGLLAPVAAWAYSVTFTSGPTPASWVAGNAANISASVNVVGLQGSNITCNFPYGLSCSCLPQPPAAIGPTGALQPSWSGSSTCTGSVPNKLVAGTYEFTVFNSVFGNYQVSTSGLVTINRETIAITSGPTPSTYNAGIAKNVAVGASSNGNTTFSCAATLSGSAVGSCSCSPASGTSTSCTAAIPGMAQAGTYNFTVSGWSANSASTTFTVKPPLTINTKTCSGTTCQ